MLRLTTLGALDLRDRHGHPVRDVLAQPKRVALLAYLVVEGARGPVARDRLLALFWPESDEGRARNALSQALHHLRQSLGPGLIESQGPHRIGVDAARIWCDATVFAEALQRGNSELALDLYRGEFCPALFVSGSPDLEHWLDEQRRGLRARALAALRTLADRLDARGDREAAARAARRALAMQPDDEADVRALLAVLERGGDAAGALVAYREYERRLAEELDTTPAPETRRLVEEMRRRRAVATAGTEEAPAAVPSQQRSQAAEPVGAPSPVPPRGAWGPPRAAVLAVVALLTAVAAVSIWRMRAAGGVALDDNALATFPFTVRGEPSAAYLRDAMVALLDTRLDGAGALRTIDPHAVLAAAEREPRGTMDPRRAWAISRRLGARLYVLGEVVVAAGRFHLDASLYDGPKGAALAHAAADADSSSLFRSVDALAGQLLAARLSGASERLARVAAATTTSLPALRAYVDGERAYRDGRYQAAADAFESATRLDTAFALAWYRQAIVRDWNGGSVQEAVDHARAHAASLAPRDQNLLFGLWLYGRLDDRDAEHVYNVSVTQHPDDVDAWSYLGETRFHLTYVQGRSLTDARDPFTRVLELDPGNPNALLHLVRIAALDRAGDLDTLARAYLGRHPDADRAVEVQSLLAFVHRDSAAEVAAVTQLAHAGDLALDAAARSVAAFAQDMKGTERVVPLFAEPKRTLFYMRRGRALAADLALAEGRWSEARVRLAALASVEPDWATEILARDATERLTPVSPEELAAVHEALLAWRIHAATTAGQSNFQWSIGEQPALRAYLLGLVSVRLGDTAGARSWAERLDRMPHPKGDSDLAGDLAHSVRAEIAFAAGAVRQALEQIQQVHFSSRAPIMNGTVHSGAHERFLHAELLHAAGRDDEALRWYGSFPEPSGYDIGYLAPAYLRQGEISERLGRRSDALAFYRRAADLWRDCEPGLKPQLAEARRAVERLSSKK